MFLPIYAHFVINVLFLDSSTLKILIFACVFIQKLYSFHKAHFEMFIVWLYVEDEHDRT